MGCSCKKRKQTEETINTNQVATPVVTQPAPQN